MTIYQKSLLGTVSLSALLLAGGGGIAQEAPDCSGDDCVITAETGHWTDDSGSKGVKVRGNWGGNYTGSAGDDMIVVESGHTASGIWSLAGNGAAGNDMIQGAGAISGAITFGNGNDTIGINPCGADDVCEQQDDNPSAQDIAAANGLSLGDVTLGNGANGLWAASAGSITGGDGTDNINVTGNVSGDIHLGGGATRNYLQVEGQVQGTVTSASTELEQVMLDGGATGAVSLGNGTNILIAGGVLQAGYTGGTGNDWISFRGAADISTDVATGFNLGGGSNLVVTESHTNHDQTVKIALSNFSSAGGTKRMIICGGRINPGDFGNLNPTCVARTGDSRNPGFHVELDVTGGTSGWDSIKVENHQTVGRANVFIKGGGDFNFTFDSGSKFGNTRVYGDGQISDIVMSGNYEFAEGSVFVLDIGSKDGGGNEADVLDLRNATYTGAGPAIDVQVAARGIDQSSEGRIDLVRTSASNPVRPGREFVRIGSTIWGFGSNEDKTIHHLMRTDINLEQEAVSGQHVVSSANAIASSVSSAASPSSAAVAASASQSRAETQGSTPLWTHVTMADQTEQVVMGAEKPEVEQSFWMLNSGSDLYSHELQGARITHSLLLQYGSAESKGTRAGSKPLETSMTGFGYSVEMGLSGGGYGRLTAMSTELSGDTGPGFSISGTSISAEGGYSVQMSASTSGAAGTSLSLTPSARYTVTEFGDLVLPSATSRGIGKTTLDLGARLDYETSGVDSSGRPTISNLYGGVNYSQDLDGGYEFTPKTSDGKDTLAISVNTEKTWITLDAGYAWGFGSGSRAFVEFSTANVTAGEASGSRQSYTAGFDLSW